jgi:imidazoleglycerol-phosphate dehydratase
MRKTQLTRKTKETDISIKLNLDGKSITKINTGIAFLDHMLTLFSKHGSFDIELKAKGDIDVDAHHLVEDTGIVLGSCIKKALGEKLGITRYGFASIPMDDTLAEASLDISGRPYLVYNVIMDKKTIGKEKEKYELYKHFFYSLVINSGITLHINLKYGDNFHHNMEAIFKAFARALKESVNIDPKTKGIPSTKGRL